MKASENGMDDTDKTCEALKTLKALEAIKALEALVALEALIALKFTPGIHPRQLPLAITPGNCPMHSHWHLNLP
jgi:hypothetical protein